MRRQGSVLLLTGGAADDAGGHVVIIAVNAQGLDGSPAADAGTKASRSSSRGAP